MPEDIKKACKYYDGTQWIKILLETSEDQIKSGFAQTINGQINACRTLPGGIKIQSGFVAAVSSANGAWVTLPEAFSTACFAVLACSKLNNSNVWVANIALNKFAVLCSANTDINWIAVGI